MNIQTLEESSTDSESPFYLTKFWFQTLNKYVFSDCTRVNLISNGLTLAHVKTKVPFKFLKLNTLKSLTNYYSPDFLPEQFSGPEKSGEISSFYKEYQQFSQFDLVDLAPLSELNADSVTTELNKLGFFCEKYQMSTNWTHPGITSIDDFWAIRPNRMKNILKSKKLKLQRDHKYEIKILDEKNIDDFQQMLGHYHDVYNKSWKNNEPYTNFIDDIALEEHKKGKLRLGILYYDDVAVAAQIWFVHHQTAYIFKLSYDNVYRTESFGTILMEALFNHVIDQDKVTMVDFLTGDDKYKADWMTASRPLFGIKAYNKKTLKGFICTISIKLKNYLQAKTQPELPADRKSVV